MTQRGEASASPPPRRVSLGVLGLGARWQRTYRGLVDALPELYGVSALADPLRWRADEEARRLQCRCAAGPTELLESRATEALLLVDLPWYGFWPIEQACRYRKPVLCVPDLAGAPTAALALCQRVRESQLLVMPALPLRVAPLTAQLHRLLRNELGKPRLFVCTLTERHRSGDALLGAAGTALVDWCLSLAQQLPLGVQAFAAQASGFASVILEFADGSVAQICRRRFPTGPRSLRLDVIAERGQAAVRMPNRLHWQTRWGRRLEVTRRGRSLRRLLLERFHETIVGAREPVASLDDALRAQVCLRAAERSLAEGRKVALD